MCRFLCISCFGVALVGNITLGQTAPTDSQTLQSLLAEVRQLRQAMQNTTITAQRIQVMLYRLQIQGAAVSRATERLDDLRSKGIEAEFARKRVVGLVANLENLQSHTEDQRERKNRETDLLRQKTELEMRTSEVEQLRTIESDALAQVQAEQAKLIELQDRLDRLDKALESFNER